MLKCGIGQAMVCFIRFILCSAAIAYIPALIIRECPHCMAHVVEELTVSGNTFGSILYTDGKRDAKMFPDHPALVKCPKCSQLFWVEEAAEVDSGFDAAKGKQHVIAPSGQELMTYLAGATFPKDKEAYLRIRAWQAANDVRRWAPGANPAFSKQQEQNLDALAALLYESDPSQRILKAEIARELGKFDECLLLLSYQFESGYDWAVGFIKKLAEEKVRTVKPFERGK